MDRERPRDKSLVSAQTLRSCSEGDLVMVYRRAVRPYSHYYLTQPGLVISVDESQQPGNPVVKVEYPDGKIKSFGGGTAAHVVSTSN